MYSVRFTTLVHAEGKFVTWRSIFLAGCCSLMLVFVFVSHVVIMTGMVAPSTMRSVCASLCVSQDIRTDPKCLVTVGILFFR